MSINTSLKSYIETNFSDPMIRKELINKLDDNKLTGTEISLIESAIQKSNPKKAEELIAKFEEALKIKLDINIPNIRDAEFNASSFNFNITNNKFEKETTSETNEVKSLKDILNKSSSTNSISLSLYTSKIDDIKTDKQIEPEITNFKDDVQLNIKKFSILTKKDNDDFRKLFPNSNTIPLSLSEKESDDISKKVFGMNTKDLQKLIGETDGKGKFTPKTLFLIKEYLAINVNESKNFDDCKKVLEQIKLFKQNINNNIQDNRLLEIEKSLELKTLNILNDDINKQTTLSGLNDLSNKFDFIKKEKIGDLSFGNWKQEIDKVENEPNNLRLKSVISDKIKTVLLNKIHSADINDLDNINKFISKNDKLTDSDKSLLMSTLNSKITNLLDKKLNQTNNIEQCIDFKNKLKQFKDNISPETFNIFKEQISRKAVPLLDKEISNLNNPKPSDVSKVANHLLEFSGTISDGSLKPLNNSLTVKERIANIFGEKGIDFNDIHQGGLGDCYFMSALSALAKNRPEDIKKMITFNSDCSIIFVKFPNQKEPIGISYPTQEELSKYAHNGKDGDVWVAAIEKAYALTTAFRDGEGNKDNPRENIAHGGHLSTGIELLTSNSTDDDLLIFTKDSTIRKKLKEALSKNKMITVGSKGDSDSNTVDGIPQNHAYTVLNYDPKTDKVTLRNPWGGNAGGEYRGKGNDGIFEISISELNKYFTNITYEE